MLALGWAVQLVSCQQQLSPAAVQGQGMSHQELWAAVAEAANDITLSSVGGHRKDIVVVGPQAADCDRLPHWHLLTSACKTCGWRHHLSTEEELQERNTNTGASRDAAGRHAHSIYQYSTRRLVHAVYPPSYSMEVLLMLRATPAP
jgi:hypothetical protein